MFSGSSNVPPCSSLRPALWAKAPIVVSAVGINTPAVPQHSHKQISGRQSQGLAAPSVASAGWLVGWLAGDTGGEGDSRRRGGGGV